MILASAKYDRWGGNISLAPTFEGGIFVSTSIVGTSRVDVIGDNIRIGGLGEELVKGIKRFELGDDALNSERLFAAAGLAAALTESGLLQGNDSRTTSSLRNGQPANAGQLYFPNGVNMDARGKSGRKFHVFSLLEQMPLVIDAVVIPIPDQAFLNGATPFVNGDLARERGVAAGLIAYAVQPAGHGPHAN